MNNPDSATPPIPDTLPKPVPAVTGLAPGTVGDWRAWAASELLACSGDDAAPEADELLAAVLGSSRSRLALIADQPIEAAAVLQLASRIERRRSGEPLAYIVGSRGFWTLDLAVDTTVLIPRPDTETLVEWALACVRSDALVATPCGPALARPYRIADLGTGSGAIALALASELPDGVAIIATDASEAALDTARENARRLGLDRVAFRLGDWFAALDDRPDDGLRFDLIVSNPPYIAAGDPHLAALRYEPKRALVAGTDGLDAIRAIAAGATAWLMPGGWLLLEHGHDQATAVRALLTAAGFTAIETRRDYGGNERCTGGRIGNPAEGLR